MNNLTDFDFLVLKFINKFDEVHIDKIKAKFSDKKYSIDYRIELLSAKEKHKSLPFYKENTSYIEMNYKEIKNEWGCTEQKPLDTYSITEKGKKILLDQQIVCKKERWKTFKHSILYPAITAIIVSLITSYLTIKR